MQSKEKIDALLTQIGRWATARADISALMLFGSWARGEATAASDVDIKIICDLPGDYRSGDDWLQDINWAGAGFSILSWKMDDFGDHLRQMVCLDPELELEFSFSTPDWCDTEAIATGTAKVMGKGTHIQYDRDGLLTKLVEFTY